MAEKAAEKTSTRTCTMKPNEKLAAIIITALKRDLASHQGELKILIAGKTGQGKSALVNGLIGHEIAKEGAKVDRCTEEVTEYSMNLEGIRVTVFDSPGLQDRMEKDKDYVRSMKERCQQLSLVVYCTKMTNHRLSDDDKMAMRTLTHVFGESFWEYSVIALTFANTEDCQRKDDRDEDTGPEPALDDEEGWKALEEKRFKGRLKIREEELKHFLTKEINVNPKFAKSIPVVPVGDYRITKNNRTPYLLPDRKDWFNDFWQECCLRIKDTILFLQINESRIEDDDPNKAESDSTNPHDRKIYLTGNFVTRLATKLYEKCASVFSKLANFLQHVS